jgi:hypothetical protein
MKTNRRTKSKTQKAVKKSAPAKGGKFVYFFGRRTDGNGTMKPLLGGKGANLAEMCRIGLPVPPGFTITTEVCTYYYANKRTYPPTLRQEMERGIASLEQQTGKKFGDLKNPLLVSVSPPSEIDGAYGLAFEGRFLDRLSDDELRAVVAHELGHVMSQRAPVQREFDALVTATGAQPFTRYAASNPESEFFAEACALYLLDPAWVNDNHPELYARVRAYLKRPRSGEL